MKKKYISKLHELVHEFEGCFSNSNVSITDKIKSKNNLINHIKMDATEKLYTNITNDFKITLREIQDNPGDVIKAGEFKEATQNLFYFMKLILLSKDNNYNLMKYLKIVEIDLWKDYENLVEVLKNGSK